MSDNTSTRYAIRLPDGTLAHDVMFEQLDGDWKNVVMPNGTRALMWPEDQEAYARSVLRNIGRVVARYGLEDTFTERASVVMVRTSVEILNGDRDPEPADDYHRLPDGAEKELRSLISILEEGEERSPGGVSVPALIKQLRTIVEPDRETVVDVPVTEPRTWRSAQEIPMGVEFRMAGGSHVYRRALEGAIHLPAGTLLPLTYFTNIHGGYVEKTR